MKLFKLDGGGEDSSEELFYCNGDIEDIKAAVEEKNKRLDLDCMQTFSDLEEIYHILEERGFEVLFISTPYVINY